MVDFGLMKEKSVKSRGKVGKINRKFPFPRERKYRLGKIFPQREKVDYYRKFP